MPTISLEKIRVPTLLFLALTYALALSAPLYPVQIRLEELTFCGPTCPGFWVSETERVELQPAVLVIASGFSWSSVNSTSKSISNYSYSAHPAIALAFLLVPPLPALALMMRAKAEHPNLKGSRRGGHLDLPRKSWRVVLWGIGLCLLLLSALWAWDYVMFYGGMDSSAFIDPLLTSIIGTFMLTSLGFSSMMLAVRSRAIWPVREERDG